MQKEQYENPELDIIIFSTEDIITTSSNNVDDNQGEWDELGVW